MAKDSKMQEITVRGVTFNIDPANITDNYELIEILDDLEDNPTRLPKFVRFLTGDKYDEVKDALRDDSGRVSMESMKEFVAEFTGAVGELPNS